MSLATNVSDLATRVGTEAKALRTLINGNAPDLSALTTTAKTNLVAAVNELQAEIGASSGIDDAVTSPSSTWSSTKISTELSSAVNALIGGAPDALNTLEELATALTDNDSDIAAITTALANRVRVDAAQTFTAPQQLQARQNIDAASATDVGDTTTNFVTVFESAIA